MRRERPVPVLFTLLGWLLALSYVGCLFYLTLGTLGP